MAENNDDRGAGEGGYGRPPKQHQVKPGETRNPWGRKGKPAPKTDFMDELVEIRIDGRLVKVRRSMALDYGLFQEAVKGNVSAAKELDRRQQQRARTAADTAADALLAEEEAALDRFVRRRLEEEQARAKQGAADQRLETLKAAARNVIGRKK